MPASPYVPKNSGLILDDLSAVEQLPQFEELFGSADTQEAPNWDAHMPDFRWQGSSVWCTAFAACNIGAALNHKETGNKEVFSPYELFYRTNGSEWGNTLMNAAVGMKSGFVLESDKPTPLPSMWNASVHRKYAQQAVASQEAIERGKPFAMKDAVFVTPSPTMLKHALRFSPLMVAIGIGSNYWNRPAPRRNAYSAYHATVLNSIDANGDFHIFESLTYKQGFDGRHELAADYEILYALAFTDLPNNWYEIQTGKKQEAFSSALANYGARRSLSLEQATALRLSAELRMHPTLRPYAGKLWTVLVNALAYGGYSIQDLLNHLTSIRRGQGLVFDLNQPR